MAENSLSQAVSFLNDNSTMEIGVTAQGQPAARSDIVAYHFGKSHKNVLRDITKLRAKCPESFHRLNFEPMFIETKIGNGATRKDRAYLLTRDGFTLLVMGFTGVNAVKWKIRYIEAFNALEAAVREDHASLAREAGYRQGLDEGQAFPAVQAERKDAYLAGLKEADRLWRRNSSPRALRRMMELRRKGCTWREIGKILGISSQAARKRVARACARGGVL